MQMKAGPFDLGRHFFTLGAASDRQTETNLKRREDYAFGEAEY